MKQIQELAPCDYEISIYGVTDDSRKVHKGFLFVATKGFNVDHYDFVQEAIDNGCTFVVSDRKLPVDFPHCVVPNINYAYRKICEKFYEVNLSDFSLVGITGTDGKTTTATILQRLWNPSAYIGTNGFLLNKRYYTTNNTTPCAEELYSLFSRVSKSNCSRVVMEVSSEALLHERVDDLSFDVACFTNITGDHLGVHHSFENYVQSKLHLISLLKKDGFLIVNGDDPILREIRDPRVVKVGFDDTNDYRIDIFQQNMKKTSFSLQSEDRKWIIHSPLHGKYNVYNVAMAFLIAHHFGVDDSLLLKKIQSMRPIKGRGEFLYFGQKFDIVLDYAHTVNAVYSILKSFQDYPHIIVVSGCAGGRDKKKRGIIGSMILEMSDCAIFTMDDPRYEDPDEIINQMVGDRKDYYRIVDREEAIQYALSVARDDSVVLILGKGRDNYMAIHDKKIHYSDYAVISHFFDVK